MKKFVIAAAALAVITVSAVEVDVKGDFAQVQKNGSPVGWYANAWEGYKPAPRYEVITEDGARALHFTEIKGKYGFSWGTSLRFAAKAGDKVTVTAKVKGSGSVCFGLQAFLANGDWTGVLPASSITLTKEWKDVKVELNVADVKNKVTGKVMLTFGASPNSELYIAGVKVDCSGK